MKSKYAFSTQLAALLQRYPNAHPPWRRNDGTTEYKVAPLGILGTDIQISIVVEYTTDNSSNDNLVPLSIFTPHVSVHFRRGSITFLTKCEGSVPYVTIPIPDNIRRKMFPGFANTVPAFNIQIKGKVFPALFDSGSNGPISLTRDTAHQIGLSVQDLHR